MANEWTSRPLRDCATWSSGGTPSKGNPNYWNGSIPWISAKSLTGFFISDSEDKVTEAGSVNGTRLVPANTILFIVRGMSLKSEFRMGITTRPVTFNQDLKALIAHDDILPAFLAYSIKGRTQEVLGLVGEAGHGTGVLPTDRIQRLEISVPPLEEQRAIVHILGTLDDKIELNRKQNETLEAMASALFKAWFVDFEPVRAKQEGRWQRGQSLPGLPAHLYDLFPDRLVDSELGYIPEGWGVGPLEELLVLQRGFDLPAQSRIEGEFPVIAAGGINGTHHEAMVKGPGVVTGRSGVLGNVFLELGDYWPLNTTLWVKEFRAAKPCYAYELLRSFDLKMFNAGSAVPTLNRNHIHVVPQIIPPSEVIGIFEDMAMSLHEDSVANNLESRSLTQLRDALLPKLMSGKLRVPLTELTAGATV